MEVAVYGVVSFATALVSRTHRHAVTSRIKGKAFSRAPLLIKIGELMLGQSAYLVILILMVALILVGA